MSDDLAERVAALEAKVEKLESRQVGRPGKKLTVQVEGVCGLDPESDSSLCTAASMYRRRQGCLGLACKRVSSDYYKAYRA